MLKLSVFKMKDGIEKNWDTVDYETEIEVVAVIEGETNQECEDKVVEKGFGDTDVYGTGYYETI